MDTPPTRTHILSLPAALPISGEHVLVGEDRVERVLRAGLAAERARDAARAVDERAARLQADRARRTDCDAGAAGVAAVGDRKSTRLNSSHVSNSYAVFCLTKK